MIGVTGASGHLGQAICEALPDAIPIGRELPSRGLQGIIHAAAPNYRDATAVLRFRRFVEELEIWINFHRPGSVVVVGSWWQHAEGTCRELPYTRMKDLQRRAFRGAAHVIPYSIYGEEARAGRGFVPHLIQAIRGEAILDGLSGQGRDFIHVGDVAAACIRALEAPPGDYLAATRKPISPRELAAGYGITAQGYEEWPGAEPTYGFPDIPGWAPEIDLARHIQARI